MSKGYSFRNQEINMNTELRSALLSIWGVGWSRAITVTSAVGVAYPFSGNKLNFYFFCAISHILNHMLISEAKGQRTITMKIKHLTDLHTYHGRRHNLYLPVRGQRSRTNGRTRKQLRFKR